MSGSPTHTPAEVVAHLMRRDAFSQLLGMEVLEASEGRAVLRMAVREDMVNGFGTLHGGALFSLADSAFAFATNGGGTLSVAIDMHLGIPVASYPGDVLVAVAVEQSQSNRLAFVDVTVRNQREQIVGHFRGTVYRTTRQHELA
ncbi:hydroxyphenylacetyl-CoA thioesterase PaaI [Gemmatimonas sp. UBA7669]|uniref:hydroxyphenylacetyl-CoA thioesterase PaaI n=1 Tax=Gemmatimonas sp. UBA7669 TaxID=1946568 RepID=UPI0025B96906|nr:hydroxyphenylacetyl-CoA thioesterase PaaI [Gemmatimonas sp. UBA7669]